MPSEQDFEAQMGESPEGYAAQGDTGDADLSRVLEAVLMASDKALTHTRIAEALGVDADSAHDVVVSLVTELNGSYEREGRSFRIERLSGGFRLMTLPEFAWAVAAIRGMQPSSKLSKASIEALSIIAYKQPITRAEIDAIRGVSSGEVVKGLLDRRLVAITGRAETLGRPMLYGTTKRFLEAFGLASLRDLPPVEDGFEAVLANHRGETTSDGREKELEAAGNSEAAGAVTQEHEENADSEGAKDDTDV